MLPDKKQPLKGVKTMKDEYLKVSDKELTTMILKSKEFRNSVATAHGVGNKEGHLLFKGTCSYPKRYKVSEEMILKAKAIRSRATKKTLKQNKNNLLFVGMGWHKAESAGTVGNCRIRTIIKNDKGQDIFIELSSGKNFNKKDNKNYIHCDFCFIVEKKGDDYQEKEIQYNYMNLESGTWKNKIEWTTTNILNYINKNLSCSFKKIVIDNFDIYMEKDVVICESLKE